MIKARLVGQTRFPKPLVWTVVFICILPYLLHQLGVDFSTHQELFDLSAASEWEPHELHDAMHSVLSGSFVHTLLEWSAVCTAVFTVCLAFTNYSITKDPIVPIIGLSLFFAGVMDTFNTVAAEHLIDAVADNRNLIPFTWTLCRLFNALILILGTSLFSRRSWVEKNQTSSLGFVIIVSLGFGLIAYGIIHICATRELLPETTFPNFIIPRPWDILPLLLFIAAGIFIYPSFHQRYPSLFSYSLIVSTIPDTVAQLHMAFGSQALFDSHFHIAHFLKIIAYLIPLVGLILDYQRTYCTLEHVNKRLVLEIAKQQETEEKLQRSVKELSDFKYALDQGSILAITDQKGVITYVNDRFCHISKYSREELIGQSHLLINSNYHPKEFFRNLWSIIASGQVWQGEIKNQAKDGTYYWVDTTIVPFLDDRDKPYQYLAIRTDISDRKQAEEDLKQAKEAAVRAAAQSAVANRAKSEFLANISHELRTPLNGILGYTQILKRSKSLSDQSLKGIDIIHQCGNHLLTLINDILDLSKIEAGKMELYRTDFHFPSFLQNLIDICEIRVQNKDILFTYQPLSELPTGIHADEKRLRQVLINLLGNGIKFTDTGDVKFTVSVLKSREKENGHMTNSQELLTTIRFKIEDTGIGMSPEQIERIFLPFEQVGNPLNKAQGTGLGLAITQKLVQMMGSKLEVSSQLGIGTVFWFDLQLKETTAASKPMTPQRGIIGFKGQPPTILVVDDKQENRWVIVNLLAPLGFELVEASSGQEGLEEATAFPPDLIITDLLMPQMDGFEMIRQLRQSPQLHSKVVIASSASVFDTDKEKSSEAGADDFLPKPVEAEKLLEMLQVHLKLEWIYQARQEGGSRKKKNISSQTLEIVTPPVEKLSQLYDLARAGLINDLLKQIDNLEKSDPNTSDFVQHIRELAQNFQLKKIRNFIKDYIQ
ncbi:ATP-binding protein [Moorena producens]|uniref:ATP-binding protein n=1 Tax=Moorena producens TaxID=1155739 RepID=UPI003C768DCC